MNKLQRIFGTDKVSGIFLVGDIHNHCGISYGHGSLDDAIHFASLQLDFAGITGHFAWPDMAKPGMRIPRDVMDYHLQGFAKLRRLWPEYLEKIAAAEQDTALIMFPSYEYHHFDLGDYTVIARDRDALLPSDPAPGEEDLRLQKLIDENDPSASGVMAFPHHIGYKTGYRGIDWDSFNEKTTPLVEIISMHGCAESHDNPFRYLHTMGPRSGRNTMQGGLKDGHFFGVIGNTDHHNASPGSYGFGRTGLWADDRSRDGVWDALLSRRTVALSGDPIEIDYTVDGHPMGSEFESDTVSSRLDCHIAGCSKLSHVDLVVDDEIVSSIRDPHQHIESDTAWVPVEFGWGKKNVEASWNIAISIEGGMLVESSTRFRGNDIVAPLDDVGEQHRIAYSRDGNHIDLQFRSAGNLNTLTDNGQGLALCISGISSAVLSVDIEAVYNGNKIRRHYSYKLSDVIDPVSEYLDGFVSPSMLIGVPVPLGESCCHLMEDIDIPVGHSFYIRVFEDNGDFAIASPVRKRHKVE